MKYIKIFALLPIISILFVNPYDIQAADIYSPDISFDHIPYYANIDQSFETHIGCIVKKEMSSSWPIEALKAQAVLARTFEIKAGRKNGNYAADQTVSLPKTIGDAVSSTAGMILMWNNQPAAVFYHADSGGSIASAADVWGGNIPYLMSKNEPFIPSGPTAQWQQFFSVDDIASRVSKYNINVGQITAINILKRDSSGRVVQLEICGTNGRQVLSGGKLRSALGLKSTLFNIGSDNYIPQRNTAITNDTSKKANRTVKFDRSNMPSDSEGKLIWLTENHVFTTQELMEMLSKPENIDIYVAHGIARMKGKEQMPKNNKRQDATAKHQSYYEQQTAQSGQYIAFTGRGWGHGVGMSQWGAKTMAEHGWDFKQILSFYFPGTTIAGY